MSTRSAALEACGQEWGSCGKGGQCEVETGSERVWIAAEYWEREAVFNILSACVRCLFVAALSTGPTLFATQVGTTTKRAKEAELALNVEMNKVKQLQEAVEVTARPFSFSLFSIVSSSRNTTDDPARRPAPSGAAFGTSSFV
eukprot:2096485-Pyramimonas_sp.AAC.1